MVQNKSQKNSINRCLLIAGMLILHQPIAYAGWRDDIANIWNKLVVFNKESNIPFIIGSGIAFAAAVYFLSKRGSRRPPQEGLPSQQEPQRIGRPGMLSEEEIKLKATRELGTISEELQQTIAAQHEAKELHQKQVETLTQLMTNTKKETNKLVDDLLLKIQRGIDILNRTKEAVLAASKEEAARLVNSADPTYELIVQAYRECMQNINKIYTEAQKVIMNTASHQSEMVQTKIQELNAEIENKRYILNQHKKLLDETYVTLLQAFTQKIKIYEQVLQTHLDKIKHVIEVDILKLIGEIINEANLQNRIKAMAINAIEQAINSIRDETVAKTLHAPEQMREIEASLDLLTDSEVIARAQKEAQEEIEEIIEGIIPRVHHQLQQDVQQKLQNILSADDVELAMPLALQKIVLPVMSITQIELRMQLQKIIHNTFQEAISEIFAALPQE